MRLTLRKSFCRRLQVSFAHVLLDDETRDEADLRWAALDPGQLVKDGFFTLFEAVGALEVRPFLCCI